jgi:hypothetical protein
MLAAGTTGRAARPRASARRAADGAAPSRPLCTPSSALASSSSHSSGSRAAPTTNTTSAAAAAAAAACGRGGRRNPAARRASNLLPAARAAAPAAQEGGSSSSSGSDAPTAPNARGAGRMTYYPSSYLELVGDAACAVDAALADGLRRLEVEFPPVPTGLDAYKGSSDLFIDSNVQLALTAAKMLAGITPLPAGAQAGAAAAPPTTADRPQRKIHIVVPDLGEYARSYKLFKPALEALGGRITMGHLKEADPGGGVNPFDLVAAAAAALAGAGAAPDPNAWGAAADVLIVVNATCTDLPALEAYVQKRGVAKNEETRGGGGGGGGGAPAAVAAAKGPAFVSWNLELDTLRGDLGLLGYPPKVLHHRFLSTVRPAFFLRTRDYSKGVPVAPFIVNYSGALLREWPGPWQVMLRQDGGEYACIAEDAVRYNLGELKDELTAAMGLDTEAAGSVAALLRRGYKTSTWFEDDAENELSREWRL